MYVTLATRQQLVRACSSMAFCVKLCKHILPSARHPIGQKMSHGQAKGRGQGGILSWWQWCECIILLQKNEEIWLTIYSPGTVSFVTDSICMWSTLNLDLFPLLHLTPPPGREVLVLVSLSSEVQLLALPQVVGGLVKVAAHKTTWLVSWMQFL